MGRAAYRAFLNRVLGETDPPVRATDRSWDHLIVLDACRHDVLEAVVGRGLPSLVSPGSATVEWLEACIVSSPRRERLSDVVLVSANPYHSQEFFERQGWVFPYRYAFDLWRDPFWDHEWQTVLPSVVTTVTKEVAERGHRLLVHFMQPHFPPITEPLPGVGIYTPEVEVPGMEGDETVAPVWTLIEQGRIPLERAVRLYEENLREVLPHVRALASSLEGRVVVTSDHGNLFGEYGLYGHPEGIRVPELVRVPWFPLSGDG